MTSLRGYRKFIVALVAIASATGLRAFDLIDNVTYGTVVGSSLTMFMTASVVTARSPTP